MNEVHVIVPEWIDDPARPSGGNRYGRRVCDGLAALGWTLREHRIDPSALARAVARIPNGATVLIDGLLASPAPEALVPHARRLRLVVLLHMPLGDDREREVLESATAVIATSAWTKRRLDGLHGDVHVAEPGVDPARLARGTASGGELLCVAAVTPVKGHDALLDALAPLAGLDWRCTCVGSLDRDPVFAEAVRRRAAAMRLTGERHAAAPGAGRVCFTGPRTGAALDAAYAAADLLVLPSRAETYGMVVTEALARGVPVVAADVGGVPDALAGAGRLVPPGDAPALSDALRGWLEDAELRRRLRHAARARRETLRGWGATTAEVAGVLARVATLEGAAR